jgi:hypothetical protein
MFQITKEFLKMNITRGYRVHRCNKTSRVLAPRLSYNAYHSCQYGSPVERTTASPDLVSIAIGLVYSMYKGCIEGSRAADALVVENKSIQSPILSRHVFSNTADMQR